MYTICSQQIGFAKIECFLNAPESNFVQSTELQTPLVSGF